MVANPSHTDGAQQVLNRLKRPNRPVVNNACVLFVTEVAQAMASLIHQVFSKFDAGSTSANSIAGLRQSVRSNTSPLVQAEKRPYPCRSQNIGSTQGKAQTISSAQTTTYVSAKA